MTNNCQSKNATTRTRIIKSWAERDHIKSRLFSSLPTHSTPEKSKVRRSKLMGLLESIKDLSETERLPSEKAKELIDTLFECRI